MKKNNLLVFFFIFSICGCDVSKYKYYNEENYTILQTNNTTTSIEIDNVKNINIDWLDGTIYFKTSNEVSKIQIYEEFFEYKPVKNEYARYSVDNDTLDIKFTKSNIAIIDDLDKDLYIVVPGDYSFDSVYINSESSGVNIEAINIDSLKIEQVSGNNKIKAISNTIDIKSVSSNTDIYLNFEDGFESTFDTVSGKFNSELAVTVSDGVSKYYSSSSRNCKITCKTTSGNLNIKKNA